NSSTSTSLAVAANTTSGWSFSTISLSFTSNVQDTFVFNLNEANGFGSNFNPATIQSNAQFGGDMIMDFDPADGDKIKIMDGTDALSPADAASMLSVAAGMGMYTTYITGTSGVLFSSTQFELSTVLESNFTDV
ncbi:hypothetical protein IDH31_01615, partial [Pelagibacterales bacterium SAG-MED32]|nr:hypothetical protein [Pelagibacterales bacterium SAG-MED32]